jgi:IrrE N-terminal-like domain
MQSALALEPPVETASDLSTSAGDQESTRKALDDLITRALAYRTGPELKALFDFMRRFPHIAPYNATLLHVQNPGIGYALRARFWERDYRRRVRPGARPYVVMQPFGPVAFVFELSDTEPIDPAVDLVPEIAKNPFPAKGQPPLGAIERLISACAEAGIEVERRDRGTILAGSVQRLAGRTPEFHLLLNSKHTEAQQLGTLAHELAHVFCGHLGYLEEGFWPDRRYATKVTRELEAESVAYLVTDRLNLDIGSVQYLASYLSDDKPLPNYSLDSVLKAVGKIEEMLRGTFRVRRTK